MSKHKQKLVRSLSGEFIGWGDERKRHRYIKLATASGEQTVKVAKSLRSQIQGWQPGILLNLLTYQSRDLRSGKTTVKVKQLLTPPLNNSVVATVPPPVASTEIRVCQGSSCRRRGSEKICQAMQTYIQDRDLTERVEIKPVKCLHQCKAAPHAIVTDAAANGEPHKTHYRQVEHHQIKAIFDKHFPVVLAPTSSGATLIEYIINYLKEQIASTACNSAPLDTQSCKT
jgi:(2Fe-2S) ferredoxin